uniref:Transmembrane protein 126A n=1 Tax=Nothobranchius korthausae TaxID=1143690 RepID=A0A1A8H141_9TELE
MSENTEEKSVSQTFTRMMIAEMLMKNFEKLPDSDQKLFVYGPLSIGGNAGFGGLIANSLYRRALNVQPARIASSLPMFVLPFLTTYALYQGVVVTRLLTGDLDCPSCSLIRGALVGAVGGALYPVVLALPLNIGLAVRYSTCPLPEKADLLRFCVDVSKPVFKKMRPVFLIQTLFGTYLGSRNFRSYSKLAQITFRAEEEIQE